MASGTVQPDIRSLDHALKGTGYSLNVDISKVHEIENVLSEGLKEYDFNPATTTADARVLGFPMPGGAIGPNVHMMVKAGILNKYSEVLAEFPVVVEAGGAWTSVTPGSQQYWLQAFNNVMYGRWEKIESGYGRAVLGYFGKTPLAPDPKVVEAASAQLNLAVFDGDPLQAAAKNIEPAREALKERNLPVNDVNTFLVLASMVPGKKTEVNEGIRYLEGKGKIDIPLKTKTEEKQEIAPKVPAMFPAGLSKPVTTKCTIEEKGKTRVFTVTLEAVGSHVKETAVDQPAKTSGNARPVFSTFAGIVDVVDILVKAGDTVSKGQVVAQVEAMKAKHDIKSQEDGIVSAVFIKIGDEIDSSQPILTIE
jgi:pyruvate carboxylase subunit B